MQKPRPKACLFAMWARAKAATASLRRTQCPLAMRHARFVSSKVDASLVFGHVGATAKTNSAISVSDEKLL